MKRSDLLALEFYKTLPFSGSENGTRFRVEKFTRDVPEDSDEKPPLQLKATVWPEPFSFKNTPDDKKESATFDFSEDGLLKVTDWINSKIGSVNSD